MKTKKFLVTNNKYLYLLILLILLGILLTVSQTLKTKSSITNISSKAAGEESKDIIFDSGTNYGQTNLSIGIAIPNNIDDTLAQNITNLYDGKNIYLKIANPDTGLLDSSNFRMLTSRNYSWYFLFSQNNNVTSFLTSYFQKYDKEAVVELATFDASLIQDLKIRFTKTKFHTSNFLFWPRDAVKNVLSQVSPPKLEAISFRTEKNGLGDVFADIKLMFDTFYDASKDIPGNSGIKINYPANTILSLSGISVNTDIPKSVAYQAGLIYSTIVSSVQSQGRNGQAPIRYMIVNDYSAKTQQEKYLIKYFAEFLTYQPQIVWPMAIPENGDPYDNAFFPQSNTKPVIGVIGKITNGYFIIFSNISDTDIFANLEQDLGLANYKFYSTIRGSGNFSTSSKQIKILPYETIFASLNLDNLSPAPTLTPTSTQPSLTPTVTNTPLTATPTNRPSSTPTPTSTPTNTPTPYPTTGPARLPKVEPSPYPQGPYCPVNEGCTDKSKGDGNCNGVVDQADYDIWLTQFDTIVPGDRQTPNANYACVEGNSSTYFIDLTDFEVWRRYTIGFTGPTPGETNPSPTPTTSQPTTPSPTTTLPTASPTACPPTITGYEVRPTGISNYCTNAAGITCNPPNSFRNPLHCYNASTGWYPYGPSCTNPNCDDCLCISPTPGVPTATPRPTDRPDDCWRCPGGDCGKCSRSGTREQPGWRWCSGHPNYSDCVNP